MNETIRGRRPVTTEPPNAEVAQGQLLNAALAPGDFYLRCNFPVPQLDPALWRLQVGGAVARPLALSLADLQALPAKELTVTLECAGNARLALDPLPEGTPWGFGAVSTTSFVGTPLAGVLERAGLAAEAVEVLAAGADRGEVEPGRTVTFERSLPRAAALHPDTLLVWNMAGAPLTAEHGAPVRLLVPGWYGMAAVKWLTSLTALTSPFAGHFQTERYIYSAEEGTPEGTPVAAVRLRSVFETPHDGAVLPLEPLELTGAAWSGGHSITRVEVSTDGGGRWQAAALGENRGPYAARPWRMGWTPPGPGPYELVVRATDASGEIQPLGQRWNRLGYGNNAVQRLRVTVLAE